MMWQLKNYRLFERYVSKVINLGEAIIILIIMEVVLEQRERHSEIANDVYTETGSYFAVAIILCFLKRNRLSLIKVCLIFSALDSIFWNYETYK